MVPGPIPDRDVAVTRVSVGFFRQTHVGGDPSRFSVD